MKLLAIDPGNEQSAFVVFDGVRPIEHDILPNDELLFHKVMRSSDQLAIEGVACYGMPVGREVFDTCIWIGRFMQRFGSSATTIVYRADVKLHLCQSMRAKDPEVRQALLDRFGPGRAKAIGTKTNRGPCYGIASHCWSALAVAVTWWENKQAKETA